MTRLVSVNIEGDLHLDLVAGFLLRQDVDIICLQEVFRNDLPLLIDESWQSQFLPMCLKVRKNGELAEWGLAIASRLAVRRAWQDYYYQTPNGLVEFREDAKRDTIAHGIAGLQLRVGESDLCVITTHFTWTPNGAPDHNQETDLAALLALLKPLEPHVLCGDFNIPRRQNHLYQTLRRTYADHIPPGITSSIYVPFHYARDKPGVAEKLSNFMVDYIFATPHAFEVSDVELHGGISDHMAISATLSTQVPA